MGVTQKQKTMKIAILKIVSFVSLFILFSCSDDGDTTNDLTNPTNLAGTVWESPGFPNTDVEYALLEFLTESRVQGLTKRQDQELQVDWDGVFEIVNDSIFIDYGVEALKGRLTEVEIIFTIEDSVEIRFKRQ
jgi:hypothetical protein